MLFDSSRISNSFVVRRVDDDARYWLTILFLLGRIYAMGRDINRKAVDQLLHWKVFNLAKVFWIVFLHNCDGAARTCGVSSSISGVKFHYISSGGNREMSNGFVPIEGEYSKVASSAAEQECSMVF
jgi:hypothetical protein